MSRHSDLKLLLFWMLCVNWVNTLGMVVFALAQQFSPKSHLVAQNKIITERCNNNNEKFEFIAMQLVLLQFFVKMFMISTDFVRKVFADINC